jgi:dTDP-glucose 4,6-dehydratase
MQDLLVTGGCGFIGANFIHFLLSETDFKGRVINVDKLTYAGNPENLEGLAERFAGRYIFRKIDICDRNALDDVFKSYPIDGICHFAAESHVDRSIAFPDAFIQTNILGTFNLLEFARSVQDRLVRFHHVGTDEVFGSLGKEGYFTERSAYDPSSPYSASKAASDHLVKAYHRTYGLPVSLSNCSNNYGPYQFPEKLIPLMILNALAGKPLPVYGDGLNVRDWLYVRDHCRAIWLILNKGRVGETYNVGGRCEQPNLAVVQMICDFIDEFKPDPSIPSRRSLITFVKDRPGHDRRYAIDCSKIASELNWKPEETFKSGLQKTIAWYLKNKRWLARVQSGEYRSWVASHYSL